MKPSNAFRDQVRMLSGWFKEWSDCEQTVALYSLLSRLSATQARFLSFVLEQTVSDSQELKLLEQQANDPGYVSGLCNESKETAVAQLLGHLPLLHPGNADAKNEYLKLIPKILHHSIQNGIHLDESRQLLSYSVIHPALNNEERTSLTQWLTHLDECTSSYAYHPQLRNLSSDPTAGVTIPPGLQANSFEHNNFQHFLHGSKLNGWKSQTSFGESGLGPNDSSEQPTITLVAGNHGSGDTNGGVRSHPPVQLTLSAPPAMNMATQLSNQGGTSGSSLAPPMRNKRSNSLTPPTSSGPPIDTWMSAEDLLGWGNEHAPLSPQSSVTSSGSGETLTEENGRNTFLEDGSGMKDVPAWLKSLRLHKYSQLFQQLTYEEMMTLTEESLEAKNVTKGARNKIILSIRKLTEREELLRELEKDIMECNSPSTLKGALNELKSILLTPIKAYSQQQNDNKEVIDTANSTSQSLTTITVTSTAADRTTQGGSGTDNSQSSSLPNDIEQSSVPVIEGDLPGQFTRVMGKVCTQLLVSRPDEDNLSLYIQLIDKTLNHEAFTEIQKKRLASWKQQCQRACRSHPRRLSLDSSKQRGGWLTHGNTFPTGCNDYIVGGSGIQRQKRVSSRPQFTPTTLPQRINQSTGPIGTTSVQGVFTRTTSPGGVNSFLKPRPGNSHQGVQRTKSAPVRRPSLQLGNFMIQPGRPFADYQFGATEPEINNRLESLCLSVTEHALGDGPSIDRTSTL
ncbi:protein Smaug homolog 1-like [Saccoglossus kowalevskii]|uniref:Protein Smaug homolog 1-like n=1 Tax=Saccoglossus kowalevskii TaxID=10224 RepID=A0ABM0MAL4_SACKO|nr:PREDICTED: protein Smaug homolog 1-like [Saccoglossus kowalevskii]